MLKSAMWLTRVLIALLPDQLLTKRRWMPSCSSSRANEPETEFVTKHFYSTLATMLAMALCCLPTASSAANSYWTGSQLRPFTFSAAYWTYFDHV